MAPTRRRAAKQAVSYQESEPELEDEEQEDDSFSESSDASPAPRLQRSRQRLPSAATSSTAARPLRQPRKTYTEDFSESETDSDFSSRGLMDVEDDANTATGIGTQRIRTAASRTRGRPRKKATGASPRKPPRRRMFPESSPPAVTPRIRQGTSYD